MESKRLDCFEVNGKIFIIEPETDTLVQCQKLSAIKSAFMPTLAEHQAIWKEFNKDNK